jgi:hypothetical protein
MKYRIETQQVFGSNGKAFDVDAEWLEHDDKPRGFNAAVHRMNERFSCSGMRPPIRVVEVDDESGTRKEVARIDSPHKPAAIPAEPSMNTHQESAQITAGQMLEHAKEAGCTSMGIEYRENGRVTSGVLRCNTKYNGTTPRVTWVLTNAQHVGARPKLVTKTEAIALIADHYDMTCDAPAPTPPVAEPAEEAPAFRRIERIANSGEWLAYAGRQYRATFAFEADAIEWRAADPLNEGTIGELFDREQQRVEADMYKIEYQKLSGDWIRLAGEAAMREASAKEVATQAVNGRQYMNARLVSASNGSVYWYVVK